MGQKVNPTGFRVGITEDWKSRWYATKAAFGEFLVEDYKVRRFIDERLNRKPPFAAVSDVLIERTREEVTITLRTARPGLVIGPKGAEVDKLREQLEDLIKRKVAPIKVIEIKNPDLNAQLVAESIAEQLKKRASFRRILKQRAESTMTAGAKGIRIMVSGRLGGAEIARSESTTVGSVPLTTLQANVDYGYAIAKTTYGTIGVKCWIYRGMYGEEVLETDVRPGGPGPRRGRR
jgi:small subunit ribosomal protein S3